MAQTFLLLYSITNEKVIQLDTMPAASRTFHALSRSDNSGEYTLLSPMYLIGNGNGNLLPSQLLSIIYIYYKTNNQQRGIFQQYLPSNRASQIYDEKNSRAR